MRTRMRAGGRADGRTDARTIFYIKYNIVCLNKFYTAIMFEFYFLTWEKKVYTQL